MINRLRLSVLPCHALGLLFLSTSVLSQTDCRTAALPDGAPAMFCKDEKGNWKQQPGGVTVTQPVATVSSEISGRGKATYRGTWSATVSRRQQPSRNLDLARMIEQAAAANANSTRFEGAINLAVSFDGAAVVIDKTGTGGLNQERLTGLVQNGRCRLINQANTEVWEGSCNQSRFSGTITSTSNHRSNLAGRFDTQATEYLDLAARDLLRSQLKSQCDAGRNTACVELDQLK